MDLYEFENPRISNSETQPQLNHSSINGSSAVASSQKGNTNAPMEVGTGQGRLGTSHSHREEPTRKSYAAAAAKPKYGRSIDTSSLPTPGMQGEYPTICLIEEEVDRGIQYYLKSLVGRLDLVKMDLSKVKALVVEKWALLGECLVTPLGKGYLMFKFDKEEDFTKVWEQGSWLFDSQVLRLSKWTPNFSTEKETQSHAMVWVRFPGLSLEYWEVKNLLAMGKILGRPMHVDETTAMRKLGYFASVFVDIDLSKKIPDKIWVESKKHGVAFWQDVQLGKLPDYWTHCKGVGHMVSSCRFLKNDLAQTGKTVVAQTLGETTVVNAS
ncbi:hypothetical protein IFM89_027793 [Coptis chinensis]|uniref:DUF4283 domain-containing protein n=1 Tax=Coptis chinensis TaxID=261450 RepID=A0A835IVJ4_9MAGN|nr:hypothetical protein IFM89_027793 [Coptis chinensis]